MELIKFLYTGIIDNNPVLAIELFEIGNYLMLNDLIELCEMIFKNEDINIYENISNDEIIEILRVRLEENRCFDYKSFVGKIDINAIVNILYNVKYRFVGDDFILFLKNGYDFNTPLDNGLYIVIEFFEELGSAYSIHILMNVTVSKKFLEKIGLERAANLLNYSRYTITISQEFFDANEEYLSHINRNSYLIDQNDIYDKSK